MQNTPKIQAQLEIVANGLQMIRQVKNSPLPRKKLLLECQEDVFTSIAQVHDISVVSLQKASNDSSTFDAFLLDASDELAIDIVLLKLSHCLMRLKEGGKACVIIPTYDDLALLPLEIASQIQRFLLRNNCIIVQAQEDTRKNLLTLLVQYNGCARFLIEKLYTKEERAGLFIPATELP